MKRLTSLKNKLLLSAFTIILLFIGSCKKDISSFDGQENVTNLQSINNAKNWIEKQNIPILEETVRSFSTVRSNGGKINLLWDKAIISNSDSTEIIEVPLADNNKGFVMGKDDKAAASSSVTRMLVKKEKYGSYSSFMMTIVPSPEYLLKNKEDIVKNTFAKKMANFSGMVIYHKPEGVFLNGQRFEHGQPIGSLTPVADSELRQNSSSQAKVMNYALPGDDCTYYTMWDYTANCYQFDDMTICDWEAQIRWTFRSCADGGGGTVPNDGTGSTPSNPVGFRPLCKSSIKLTPSTGNTSEVNMSGVKFGITDMPTYPWQTVKSNVITFNLYISIPNEIKYPGDPTRTFTITPAMQQQFIYNAYHYASQLTNLTHGDDFFGVGAQSIYSAKFAAYVQFYLMNIALEGMFRSYESENGSPPSMGGRANTTISPAKASPAGYSLTNSGLGC